MRSKFTLSWPVLRLSNKRSRSFRKLSFNSVILSSSKRRKLFQSKPFLILILRQQEKQMLYTETENKKLAWVGSKFYQSYSSSCLSQIYLSKNSASRKRPGILATRPAFQWARKSLKERSNLLAEVQEPGYQKSTRQEIVLAKQKPCFLS